MSPEAKASYHINAIDEFLVAANTRDADVFIRNFRDILPEHISGGITVDNFLTLRKLVITSFLLNERPDLVPTMRGRLFFEASEALPDVCAWLENVGLFVKLERNEVCLFNSGNNKEWQLMNGLKERLFYDVLDEEAKGTAVSFEDAKSRMKAFLEEGFRVVVAMGTYDVGTFSQKDVVRQFRAVTQKYGKLFVLVPGDNEASLAKGVERPYQAIDSRLDSIRKVPGVDFASPIFFPNVSGSEELRGRYLDLHRELAPIVHARVIGEGPTDAIYPTVLEQCRVAGIPLIHTNFPRMDSATKYGKLLDIKAV